MLPVHCTYGMLNLGGTAGLASRPRVVSGTGGFFIQKNINER